MKTFNEFINEGHQFLRSIGKNDNIVDCMKPFNDLEIGDWFWTCTFFNAAHVRVFDIQIYSDEIKIKYVMNTGHIATCTVDRKKFKNEYTAIYGNDLIFTTDENAFLEFKNNVCPRRKIEEFDIV